MQALWVLAGVLGGAALGLWLASRPQGQAQASNGQSGSGSGVVWKDPASGVVEQTVCPQVIATCRDGSLAPTPCDCAQRGGVARIGGLL